MPKSEDNQPPEKQSEDKAQPKKESSRLTREYLQSSTSNWAKLAAILGTGYSKSLLASPMWDSLSNSLVEWQTHSASESVVSRLKAELEALQDEGRRLTQEIRNKEKSAADTEKQMRELQEVKTKFEKKLELAFLLGRVSAEAAVKLEKDAQFASKFLDSAPCNAFVVAVDIRRSTELMLKARSAAHFAKFISALCTRLENIVKINGGVFDKFTGDGILAFFPEFYSGKDAGYRAVLTAHDCQEAFFANYKQYRNSFTTVLNDVGLGIGVDYGEVNLLQVADGLTVVGRPVVYACRLSGAPAGHTYVNQCAFEVILTNYGSLCYSNEANLEVKHEGKVLCYDVKLTKTDFIPEVPEWTLEP